MWINIQPNESLFLTIMAAIRIANQYWQNQNISQKHIPHPSTWLNEERWEDEYSMEQLSSYDSVTDGENNSRTKQNAAIGENYAIGGENDPYKAIMQN